MKISLKEMCETIEKSGILKRKDGGSSPTAEEIFNYSPTGELIMIWEWYQVACLVLGSDLLKKEGG